jgi:hypothetical protein
MVQALVSMLERVIQLLIEGLQAGQGAGGGGAGDGGAAAAAPRGGGARRTGMYGVPWTCKSGYITQDVKELTRYGYNPLRQGVGTPYEAAVASWERDNGRKFPGLTR